MFFSFVSKNGFILLYLIIYSVDKYHFLLVRFIPNYSASLCAESLQTDCSLSQHLLKAYRADRPKQQPFCRACLVVEAPWMEANKFARGSRP